MYTKPIFYGVCSIALCCAPAFAQAGGSATAGASADQKFVDMAAQTDMMEAHLGQMAADQASAQGVKDFAQTLVTDHTADYNTLTAAATKAGATVPKGLDALHDRMIKPFEKLKGTAFDHRYIHEMVAGHEKAIAAYKKEEADGQSADLKQYATAALPTLEKHLQAAQDLEKGGAKSTSK
jgi:putative membrane protein